MTTDTMSSPARVARHRRLLSITGILVLLLIAAAVFVWNAFFRQWPQRLADNTPVEQFKYGSIGAEEAEGMPYWLWFVLPKMFPEYLPRPGGWAALGLSWEEGRAMPIGFSKKRIGFERVAINCAFCHTTRVRKPGEVTPHIYPAGPGNVIDPLAYQRFLFACASDPRFTASNVLREVAGVTDLPAVERAMYRVLVPATRRALLQQKANFEWTKSRPDWGRGRIDPFNPIKFGILRQEAYGDKPISEIDDHTIGNSDMQPIWNMAPRVEHKMAYHWDGLNTDLTEVVRSSALGDGATRQDLPLEPLGRLQNWLMSLQPPKFRELFTVDAALASRGEPVFKQHCADCHAMDGRRTGQLLPLTDQAWSEGVAADAPRPRYVDTHRAKMWTPVAAKAYNAYTANYPWAFKHFRSTDQTVNVPLDGVWVRAPYLHNGSVPYLDELLEEPEKRTKLFYRGYDEYDPERVGFVSQGEEAKRLGTVYDTAQPGNSNQGHLFGTRLEPADKRALLEYMKTL